MDNDRVIERSPRNAGLGSWRIRRLYMFAVTAFCMGVIIYCLRRELDTKVAESATTMAFVCIIGMVGSYVFAAVWDDNNFMKNSVTSRRFRDSRDKGGEE